MRILITGGCGFIGTHLVDKLINNNHQVMVYDNLSSGQSNRLNPYAQLFMSDLSNTESLKVAFKNFQPEVVIHLASSPKAYIHPLSYFETNIQNTINLLKVSVHYKVKHFMFASSCDVFSDSNFPISESTIPNPTTPYGESKLIIEKLIKWADESYGMKYTIFRYFEVI